MEILRYSLEEKPYDSSIFREYFKGQRVAIFDIETTGLDYRRNRVILAAFLFLEENGFSGVQYFANDVAMEEEEVLRACAEEFKNIDVLITYNGNRFDLPFLKTRAMVWEVPFLMNVFSLDMYRVVRNYSTLGQFLPNLKQKTVENYLGLTEDRKDEIDGAESVSLYWKYLECGDPELKRLILLHNRDDVRQLSRIMKILDKLDLHRILYSEGFSTAREGKRIVAERIAFRKGKLIAEGHTNCAGRCYCGFDTGFQGNHNERDCSLSVEIPCYTTGDYTYVMKDDFPFPMDPVKNSPFNRDKALIIRDHDQVCHREANFLIHEIFREILKTL
ncbi:MAG: hypothetical protein E7224_04310 [Clostridiales bacterium]|nr:hypothetical protein [Clostridiales bacterium]